jgi:phosphoribosylformylglycinamidine cyclo-ligase
MHRSFNCGIGMVIIVGADVSEEVIAGLRASGETATLIGSAGLRASGETATLIGSVVETSGPRVEII